MIVAVVHAVVAKNVVAAISVAVAKSAAVAINAVVVHVLVVVVVVADADADAVDVEDVKEWINTSSSHESIRCNQNRN